MTLRQEVVSAIAFVQVAHRPAAEARARCARGGGRADPGRADRRPPGALPLPLFSGAAIRCTQDARHALRRQRPSAGRLSRPRGPLEKALPRESPGVEGCVGLQSERVGVSRVRKPIEGPVPAVLPHRGATPTCFPRPAFPKSVGAPLRHLFAQREATLEAPTGSRPRPGVGARCAYPNDQGCALAPVRR